MEQFRHYPNFDKYFLDDKQKEKINRILWDSVKPNIWDAKKYCSFTWDIKVNLQKWED
tara:strand:+ start:917 stop:1090 length:174 start_codon:yes stop_codon:yes gene_type:complete